MTSPLAVQAPGSTTWSTGLGLVEDVHQITTGIQNKSWVDTALGGVGASLDTLSMVLDPLGSLVSWGVSWLMEHVRPLKEALDWLTGKAGVVSAHSGSWTNASGLVESARQNYAARVRQEVSAWLGASGDAYREKAGRIDATLQTLTTAGQGISSAVEGAGMIVGMVRGIVRDLISQFVATLAARLPQWLAEAGLSLGAATPAIIGRVSALVSQWVSKIQKFVQALLNSMRQLGTMLSNLRGVLSKTDPLMPKKPAAYKFNMVENPGPLASRPGTPAANFAGGRYDEVELAADRSLFRGGDSQGSPLGQWFSTEPPAGVAEVRIDTAVKPQWIDPKTGAWQGSSPVDTVYEVQIPAGTKVYPGPVANQGDIYTGGGHQVFVPEPWKIPGVKVVGSEPLK